MRLSGQTTSAILVIASLCLCGGTAEAAATAGALANFEIDGSTDGGSTYSSAVHVTAGQTVYFRVVGYLSPVGTSNTSANKSITSLVNGQDDITQDNFNLSEANSTGIPITFTQSSLALASKYNSGSGGPSPGSASGSTVTNIFAAAGGVGSSVPLAANPTLILTGQFVVGSTITANTTTTVAGAYDFADDGAGSFKINGGTSVIFASGTETRTQPLADYIDLTLTDTPAPEPCGLSGLALAACYVVGRRSPSRGANVRGAAGGQSLKGSNAP